VISRGDGRVGISLESPASAGLFLVRVSFRRGRISLRPRPPRARRFCRNGNCQLAGYDARTEIRRVRRPPNS